MAEAEIEGDLRMCLKKFLVMGSGQADLSAMPQKGPDDDMFSDMPEPEGMPDWLTEADLDFYTGEITRSGMRGPLNYYRNHDLTWQLTEGAPNEIHQPAMFLAGDKDGVIMMAAQALQAMPDHVRDLRMNELIPGIGHWTQQEAPEQVNRKLRDFLAEVS